MVPARSINQHITPQILSSLETTEEELFEKSATSALQKLLKLKSQDPLEQQYIEIVTARQYQRLGMYKEAYVILDSLKDKVSQNLS